MFVFSGNLLKGFFVIGQLLILIVGYIIASKTADFNIFSPARIMKNREMR